jgi:hypothetical protein
MLFAKAFILPMLTLLGSVKGKKGGTLYVISIPQGNFEKMQTKVR